MGQVLVLELMSPEIVKLICYTWKYKYIDKKIQIFKNRFKNEVLLKILKYLKFGNTFSPSHDPACYDVETKITKFPVKNSRGGVGAELIILLFRHPL